MNETDIDRMFRVSVELDASRPDTYHITFDARTLQGVRGPNGAPKTAPKSTSVTVDMSPEAPSLIAAFIAGDDVPGITRAAYEDEAVRRARAESQKR